uniref:Uncharacterized protein n=2 Tax=Odontella aurita TaxID=265563 RepID=A0A7S4I992_9STRA|mmetsp:Transcript_21508/g.62990  ORF Transcript_21508/g.62990 Transcript_21508/m.62990 type:complete len:133 (+) Transcript_21508:1167-1565(+)
MRLSRRVYCFDLTSDVADSTAYFISTASSLAFAWAWEDFANDVICEVFPQLGLTSVGAVWVNWAILGAIMVPASMVLGRWAGEKSGQCEEELGALRNAGDAAEGKEEGDSGSGDEEDAFADDDGGKASDLKS